MLTAETASTLTGLLQRIIYHKAESGFVIASFQVEGQNEPITIKGTLGGFNEDETLQLKGRWQQHPLYGSQFLVEEAMPVLPSSLDGIQRYLASGIYSGIGEKTAERIVVAFGEDTFRVIDEEPERLLKEVPRFTRKQLEVLHEAREEQRGLREVMTYLHGAGVSNAQAQRIFQRYGLNSIQVLRENPYQLTELPGIGFLTADAIARKLGFAADSLERAVAGTVYVIEQQAQQGHTCLPQALLLEKVCIELHLPEERTRQAIDHLLQERQLKGRDSVHLTGGNQSLLSRPRFYFAEQRIAENLFRLLESAALTNFGPSAELLDACQERLDLRLDSVQHQAIQAALQHKVLILTGGPGTGKTTIVRFILELMLPQIPETALAAPTGRAAKRLSEATGHSASTIHRLLEAGNQGFQRNQDNPLEYELLIIDETSMIDTLLMDALLEAIPSPSRLILVGDVDQLPSVGAGAILQDLIASQQIPVVRLETIFRQAQDSLITLNAHRVRKGELPDLEGPLNSSELRDFYFMQEGDPQRIVDKLLRVCTERIPERFGFDPLNQVQVLTPMHRGLTGSIHLNQRLQEVFNPSGEGVEFKQWQFRVGDKVMQQVNNYDKEVFNGDTGQIREVNTETRELRVEFEHAIIPYTASELDQLQLAYAISVHKSQGSEYAAVLLPLTHHHYLMLQRNLLYTAMTRGKELFVLIGTPEAIDQAVRTVGTLTRYTALNYELAEVRRILDKAR